MTAVRIYRPTQTAMQSGRAHVRRWVLDFAPGAPKTADPLMGWPGSPDTEDPNDPPEDTGPTCAGLDEPSPRTFSVWSETPYEEVEVTLSGCATGITINDSYMSAGGHYYWTGTWLSVPGNVNGTATAVLAYRGSEATVGWLEFYIDTDQGQQRFTLEVRQYL